MFLRIIILIVLVLINGIFSATEMAFLSLNSYELNKEIKNNSKNSRKAKKILSLIDDSSTFLSSIQIAITLSGFLASAIAAESFASELSEVLNISFLTTDVLIIIITLILSYFTLVFGELVPKKIGLSYSKKISFFMVDIINGVIKFFKPFILLLKKSVDFILKILKIKEGIKQDEDSIKNNITDSSLEELEKKILLNVFEFNDKKVKEIMVKKQDTIFVDINIKKDELLKIIKQNKFTRYPIIDKDKIIGILNIKDLIIKRNTKFNLKNHIKNVTELDSEMIIDDAFLLLSSKKEVMALVVENGKIIGIITIEDILEEVIGNVFDEYN